MKTIKGLVKKFTFVCLLYIPIFTSANSHQAGMTVVNTLVNKISDFILKPLILLMFAIATLVFIWGVQGFVGSADDAEARGKGAQQMIWGIVGMVIMIGAFALKTIIENTVKVL